jgi:hypothetical protein
VFTIRRKSEVTIQGEKFSWPSVLSKIIPGNKDIDVKEREREKEMDA